MQITIVIVGIIEMLEFTFCIYLLISSVRLLRRFVIDHSSHDANERTAWMHVVMIALIFLGSFFESATQVIVHMLSLQES